MTDDQIARTTRQLGLAMQDQIKQVAHYVEFLDEIRRSVETNNIEALGTMLEQAPAQAQALDVLRNRQMEIVAALGYPVDDGGLSAFIQASGDPGLKQAKQDLSNQLRALEKSLLVNNLLIHKNKQRVRKSLEILSGQSNSYGVSVYSRRGLTDGQSIPGRSLAQA